MLVICGAAMLRELLRIFLYSLDIDVLEASTAAEAVRMARSHPGNIDLLFIDTGLGWDAAWESATEITRIRPAIRVHYISAGFDSSNGTARRQNWLIVT